MREVVSTDPHLRMDFVRQVHSNVTENIRLADAKAGFIAAASVALLNVIALRLRAEAQVVLASRDTEPLLVGVKLILLAWAVVSALSALACAYLALRPRFTPTRSYAAFSTLAGMSVGEYLARLEAESETDLIAELAGDTINLAKIAVRKNILLARAIRPLFAAAIAVALLVLLA